MNTQDVPLNIKEIFDRKKVNYHKHDVARMRYLCKQFVEYVIEYGKAEEKRNLFVEEGKAGTEAVGVM